jgi:hypothetical protein
LREVDAVWEGGRTVAISIPTFLCAEFIGAATIALWAVTRFPRLGPKSLRSALILCIVTLGLLQILPLGVKAAVHLPNGGYAAIFGCVLPALVAVFVAIAWLMRLLAGQLGGSGGGGGHTVPARG